MEEEEVIVAERSQLILMFQMKSTIWFGQTGMYMLISYWMPMRLKVRRGGPAALDASALGGCVATLRAALGGEPATRAVQPCHPTMDDWAMGTTQTSTSHIQTSYMLIIFNWKEEEEEERSFNSQSFG